MNRLVLDTDVLTLFQRGDDAVTKNVQAHAFAELAITIISIEEQLGGWYAELRRLKKCDQLAQFINE
jgi:tRNA(fMet)-specific endonuclease VapC